MTQFTQTSNFTHEARNAPNEKFNHMSSNFTLGLYPLADTPIHGFSIPLRS